MPLECDLVDLVSADVCDLRATYATVGRSHKLLLMWCTQVSKVSSNQMRLLMHEKRLRDLSLQAHKLAGAVSYVHALAADRALRELQGFCDRRECRELSAVEDIILVGLVEVACTKVDELTAALRELIRVLSPRARRRSIEQKSAGRSAAEASWSAASRQRQSPPMQTELVAALLAPPLPHQASAEQLRFLREVSPETSLGPVASALSCDPLPSRGAKQSDSSSLMETLEATRRALRDARDTSDVESSPLSSATGESAVV